MNGQGRTPFSDILIAGVGMTPVGEHWEISLRELALEAIAAARRDAAGLRPQAVYVANMLSPVLSGQAHLGALVADFAGLWGVEACTVEAAEASGGMAFRQACLALKAGVVDVAMVVGVEKVTDRVSATVEAAMTAATDADYEAVHGVTRAAQAALVMRRYLAESGAPPDAFAGFSLNAHANGARNPLAMYRRPLQPEAYQQAPVVSEPVTVMDTAPRADGAAALVLARAEALPVELPQPPVRVLASAATTTAVALHDQEDPLALTAAAESVRQAYRQAGLTPDAIDLFELHDTFSVYAALALEAAGFAARGEGWRLAQEGAIGLEGSIPICTFGGCKARGDTVGATGVYQLAEVALQLQGRAGENQVQGARIGMAQCLGGVGGTAVTHILGRQEAESGQVDRS